MSERLLEPPRIYPVKACGMVAVESVLVTETGLQNDRLWGVFDDDNHFASQRKPEYHQLALVQPEILPNDALRLWYKKQHIDLLAPDQRGLGTDVEVQGDSCEADIDVTASLWLTEYMGVECNLARKRDTRSIGRLDTPEDAHVQWQDRYPVFGVHIATIEKLNRLLAERGLTETMEETLQRFRPNLIFSGEGEAHDENHMEHIQIGNAMLEGVRPCERCKVPNVHQMTGEYNDLVWGVLMDHFRGANKVPVLGENFLVRQEGSIRKGDAVQILERREQGIDRPYTPLARNKR